MSPSWRSPLPEGLVLVTTSFPMRQPGKEAAGSFVYDLAIELAGRLPVRVVAPGPEAAVESPVSGLQIFRFPAPDKPLATLKPWNPKDLWVITKVIRAGSVATRNAAMAGRTRGILALWALPSGWWARQVARATGVPFAVWTLGSDIWSLGRLPVLRQALSKVLGEARTCFSDGLVLAEDTAAIARRHVEFLPSTRNIGGGTIVPASVEPPFRLLFLGRWHRNKGVDILLEALSMLGEDSWARISSIQIVGGGPLESSVRESIASLQLAGRPIQLHGYMDKTQAEAAFQRADWVLIPSRIESIPVVFSDALKMGRPVVAMPVGDLPALVGGEMPCGILADDVTPTAFAAAISSAVMVSPSRFERGVAAMAERFSLRQIAGRILEAFP